MCVLKFVVIVVMINGVLIMFSVEMIIRNYVIIVVIELINVCVLVFFW